MKIAAKVSKLVLLGLHLLQRWSCVVLECVAWKQTHPCAQATFEAAGGDPNGKGMEYERVVRYNWSPQELSALVEVRATHDVAVLVSWWLGVCCQAGESGRMRETRGFDPLQFFCAEIFSRKAFFFRCVEVGICICWRGARARDWKSVCRCPMKQHPLISCWNTSVAWLGGGRRSQRRGCEVVPFENSFSLPNVNALLFVRAYVPKPCARNI